MNESTLVPRQEMSDLDWLARNVHVWPAGEHQPWCYVYMTYGGAMKASGNFLDAVANPTMITIDQWLARRAELQNKPSWNDAPEWAEWLAQDADGEWCWYEVKPVERDGYFYSEECEFANYGFVLGEWKDTPEYRSEYGDDENYDTPIARIEGSEYVLYDPFVSVEDAKITIIQSEGDIKHFGGLIGRNLPFEEDAATAKQPTPKGSGIPILGMVLADLTNRALEGKEKYGEPLLAHNGRNPLWDAYQEALDLAMYLRQAIEEQK